MTLASGRRSQAVVSGMQLEVSCLFGALELACPVITTRGNCKASDACSPTMINQCTLSLDPQRT